MGREEWGGERIEEKEGKKEKEERIDEKEGKKRNEEKG